jgi:hypothetical protein
LFDQFLLLGSEEVSLEVVDDDGAVAGEELLGRLRETVAKLFGRGRVEPHENGLVVALGLLGDVAVESAEERVAALAGAAAPLEFRLAFRDADESDEIQLGVAGDGAAEEFVFPVRSPAEIEDAVGAAAAIHGDAHAVVLFRQLRERGLRGLADSHGEEGNARGHSGETKTHGHGAPLRPGGKDEILLGELFVLLVPDKHLHGLGEFAEGLGLDVHGHLRVLELSRRGIDPGNGEVARGGNELADEDGINRDAFFLRQGLLRREMRFESGFVGGIAVGEEDGRGEGTAAEAGREIVEGRAEGGAVAGEIESAEIADLAQSAINEEGLDAEGVADAGDPRGWLIGRGTDEGGTQGGGRGFLAFPERHGESGGVVGENGDVVGVFLGCFVEMDRFHQGEGEEDEADGLQGHCRDLGSSAERGVSVSEDEHENRPRAEEQGDPRPRFVGEGDVGEMGGGGNHSAAEVL